MKTVFAANWIFKQKNFERLQGQGHIAAKEDEGAETRKILKNEVYWRERENRIKCKLT